MATASAWTLAACVASGCAHAVHTWTGAPHPRDELCTGKVGSGGIFAKLVSGSCYGPCPSYEVSLCNDGTVVFDGVVWVKQPGRHIRRIPTATVAELATIFERTPDGPSALSDPVGMEWSPPHVVQMRDGSLRWLPQLLPNGEKTDALVVRTAGVAEWIGVDEKERRGWFRQAQGLPADEPVPPPRPLPIQLRDVTLIEDSPAACHVGAECTIALRLVARGDYRIVTDVSPQFPVYVFHASPVEGVEFLGADPTDRRVFSSKAGDVVFEGDKTAILRIRFRVTTPAPSTVRISGIYHFGVDSHRTGSVLEESTRWSFPCPLRIGGPPLASLR